MSSHITDATLTSANFSSDPETIRKFQLAATLSDRQLTKVLEIGLKQSHIKNPKNPAPLKALGLLYRRQGNLDAAKQVYRQWQQLAPNEPMAAYLSAIFNQQPLPKLELTNTFIPAPFVWIQDFLPPEQHQALLPFALQHQAAFEWASVGKNDRLDYDKRRNLVLKDMGVLGNQFQQLILNLLPELLPQLNLNWFEASAFKVKMTNNLHNGFFTYHSDGTYQLDNSLRQISFVYYFYQEPKSFQGGDLLLCDTRMTSRSPITEEYEYQVENFTRIIPTNNCLVVFPSDYIHAVTPVQLESQDFLQGRLAISGHVHKAFEPAL